MILTGLVDPRDESMLDWAIAGTTKSEARNDPKSPGKEIGTSTFYHWIDSRTTKPEDATDEGDMYPQPDGTTLEKGAMVNPDTGNLTDYEELWDDSELSDGTPCVVLQTESEEEGCRGMVILLGEYCQGFMRVGREITLERWKKTRDGQWRREFRLGNGELPCGKELLFTSKIRVGEEVVLGGRSWKVVEAA